MRLINNSKYESDFLLSFFVLNYSGFNFKCIKMYEHKSKQLSLQCLNNRCSHVEKNVQFQRKTNEKTANRLRGAKIVF